MAIQSQQLAGLKQERIGERSDQKHPLRWFLLLWVGLVYIQGLLDGGRGPRLPTGRIIIANISPELFSLWALTILIVPHFLLHWYALFKQIPTRWLAPYFLVQGLLVILIFYIADAQNAVFGLSLTLIIEAIHLLKWRRTLLVVVGGCLMLYIFSLDPLNYFATTQVAIISHKLLTSLSYVLFIIGYVILYRQQIRAHQRDQELLYALETTHGQLEQTHAQLEEAHIRLEDYAAQVEALTLTTERQRLARELHDTLAQGLVALTMQLETVDSLLIKQRAEPARAIVQQAMICARATMSEARSAIDDLRVEGVEIIDLAETIQDAIQRFTTVTGIPCGSDLSALPTLPRVIREQILRFVTEGLTNIARHAHASRAWIAVTLQDSLLVLEVYDNGIGFDPCGLHLSQAGHYGLRGLHERARLVGGQLEIKSTAGSGCCLCLRFPPDEEEWVV